MKSRLVMVLSLFFTFLLHPFLPLVLLSPLPTSASRRRNVYKGRDVARNDNDLVAWLIGFLLITARDGGFIGEETIVATAEGSNVSRGERGRQGTSL